MILEGKVKSGLGNAKFWIKKAEDVFIKRTGLKLYSGTLNIELKDDYELQNYWTIEGKEYGGTQIVYVQECEIFGHKSYIIRPEKTAHRANVLEIVSDISFREKYNLKNDDLIEIKI